jgi:7-keto-8-aminopelargonate synthetase-like enzyme
MIDFLINMKRKACFSRQLNPTLKADPLKSLKIQPMPKIVGVVDIVTQ